MANRAYLYSMPNQDAWWEYVDEREYFDSRWTIPICWWLLFDLNSLRQIEQNGGAWQEIRLSRSRHSAVSAFIDRIDLVRDVIRDRVSGNRLAFFVDVIRNWPDAVLVLDPDEVLGGYSFSDHENQVNFGAILRRLDEPGLTPDILMTATQAYSSIGDDPDCWETQIFGYTYGELADQKWIQHFRTK